MTLLDHSVRRRSFLKTTTALGAGVLVAPYLSSLRAAEPASGRLRVAIMGLGRGLDHVNALLGIPNVEIAYICDVDDQRLLRAAAAIERKNSFAKPAQVKDVRRVLDDKTVDALFVAAPNFWHSTATVMACKAGKHVYVEKPGSYNPAEGQLMVSAARKYDRRVQMGNQRRTWPMVREAVERLRGGVIGRLFSARAWYDAARPGIGRGKTVPVPVGLDYSLWQGPTPERPYVDNLIHYNWHWRWHWGNGELGNNGPHFLDVARWGLGLEYPLRIAHSGGRYHFNDDQETPDTAVATYDFGDKFISWDSSSGHPRPAEKHPFVSFYGEGGMLSIVGTGYVIYDQKGQELDRKTGAGGEKDHIANFLASIRSGAELNSEIEEGQKSTLLCHLGNIAYRVGRTVRFDPEKHAIAGDSAATRLWSRDYRHGWELKV